MALPIPVGLITVTCTGCNSIPIFCWRTSLCRPPKCQRIKPPPAQWQPSANDGWQPVHDDLSSLAHWGKRHWSPCFGSKAGLSNMTATSRIWRRALEMWQVCLKCRIHIGFLRLSTIKKDIKKISIVVLVLITFKWFLAILNTICFTSFTFNFSGWLPENFKSPIWFALYFYWSRLFKTLSKYYVFCFSQYNMCDWCLIFNGTYLLMLLAK